MENIIKIVNSLEGSCLLSKAVCGTMQNKVKEQSTVS